MIILLSNRPSLATSGSSSQNTSKPYYLLLMKQICNVMFVQKIIIFALICVYIPAVVVQLGNRLIFSTIPKKLLEKRLCHVQVAVSECCWPQRQQSCFVSPSCIRERRTTVKRFLSYFLFSLPLITSCPGWYDTLPLHCFVKDAIRPGSCRVEAVPT